MWLEHIDSARAEQIFGAHGATILSLSRQCLRGEQVEVPPEIDLPTSAEQISRNFGPNGIAIHLFVQAWKEVPWRSQEGRPLSDRNVVQVASWKEALNPCESRVWTEALFSAGFRTTDETLMRVWAEAGNIGEAVGGHHARIFAGATAGELAQIEKDLHFFLDLMPWVWIGHWPCGWSDNDSLPLIL